MKIKILGRLAVLAGCLCIATGLAAQSAPVPPVQDSLSPVLVTEPLETTVIPDQHPLTGGQTLGIGASGSRHSFFTPSLRIAETLDSNPLLLSTSNGGYRGFTNFGSNVQWTQYVGRDTEVRYSGSLRYDTLQHLQGYSPFTNTHSLAISRTVRFGIWNLLITDQAQYSQGSGFGAAGMEGMDLQGSSVSNLQSTSTSLQSNLLPNQSILIGQVGTITNTTLLELDAHLDARDTATLAASYGLLHFDSSQLTDAGQASLVAGYNRNMTLRDSIALEGAFTRFNYQDSSASLSTEYFSARYARRISGRSSIELGGGPQVTQSSISQVNQIYLGWQARGSLQYKMRRMNLSAQVSRNVSNGAGVLDGATVTTGQGAVNFVLSRYSSMALNSGVSRNQQLGSTQSYDTQFAGLALNRKIGRYTDLFLSYDFQHQTTASSCTGLACGYVGLRNVFGIGYAWNYRPISVR